MMWKEEIFSWINYLFANFYLLLNRWDRKKLGQPEQGELSSMIRRMGLEEEKGWKLFSSFSSKLPCQKLFNHDHMQQKLQKKWESIFMLTIDDVVVKLCKFLHQ